MLKIRKGSDRIAHNFVALDIENKPNGDLITLCIYDGTQYNHFNDWETCLQFIIDKLPYDKRYSTVYAHNGGGWDWLSLLDYLLKNTNDPIDCVMSGSRLVLAKITVGSDTLSFVDSFTLFWSKLDDVGEKLLGERKLKIGKMPHELYATDKAKYIKYLERDTYICYKAVVKFGELLHNQIAPIQSLGITLASTAMKVFTTGYMNTVINTPESKPLVNFLRSGYSGGRVECLKPGHYSNVWVYDINSLYPYVMAKTSVPISAKGAWTKKYHKYQPGCYHIKFKGNYKTPLFMVAGESVHEGEGVFYSPEIDRHLELGGTIEVIKGFVFTEYQVLFKEYVDVLYKLRQENKGTVIDWAAKLLLNSLYGKFGMKTEREQIVRIPYEQLPEFVSSGKVRPIDDTRDIYAVTTTTNAPYLHVGIAAMITSAARVELHKAIDCNTVYVDTDSVHSTKKRTDITIGNELGQFKLEADGEAVYVGKKLYGLRNKKGSKIRVKGVKVSRSMDDKNGAFVRFEDLLAINNGKAIKFSYRTPSTPREVLAKQYNPCKFYNRGRTIRKTV